MFNKMTKRVELFLAFGVLAWAGTAGAEITFKSGSYGELDVTGFLRAQTDIRTGPENNNPTPTISSHVQQVKQWGVLDLNWATPVDGLKAFARGRYQLDFTDDIVDENWDTFPGNGKNIDLTRSRGDDAIVELWEARVDYNTGPWWFRLGRQNIVWGDLAPTRLLDSFNPLDLSFHMFNELGGREAFDNIRIPKWALRGSYTFPSAPTYSLEAFVSPNALSFIPTQLPDSASPFDPVPIPPVVDVRQRTDKGENGVSGGVRFLGGIGDLGYSLVWMYRRESDTGVNEFVSAMPGRVIIDEIYPSYHTLGFSTNYFHAPTKVVMRTEFMFNFNRPFNRLNRSNPTGVSARHIERNELGYAIAFDRPTFLLRDDKAMVISASVEQRFRPIFDDDLLPGEALGLRGNTKIDESETIFRVILSQAWAGFGGRYDEFFTDMTFFYDVGEAADDSSFFIQPAVRWEPGSNWRWGLWYTEWGGDDRRSGKFGSLRPNSGVNLSVTYQF